MAFTSCDLRDCTAPRNLYLARTCSRLGRPVPELSGAVNARMTSALAVSAVRNAVRLRGPVDTILHSDRGSQFRSKVFVRTLKSNGLTGSMGRVGACGDNAAMESFFSLLQKNVLDRKRWATKKELRLAIVTSIERTYHRKRRQRVLSRLTPIEFEILGTTATDVA